MGSKVWFITGASKGFFRRGSVTGSFPLQLDVADRGSC